MTCPACELFEGACPECRAARGDPDAGIDHGAWPEDVRADGGAIEYGDDLLEELLHADAVFHSIGDGHLEFEPRSHDDPIEVSARWVAGLEIGVDFQSAGYDCRHVLNLDREATRELIEVVAPAVGLEVRETEEVAD